MIASQRTQTFGPAIHPLPGKRDLKSLPTWSALTESPERADDSSPGSASLRAQPWVKSHKNPSANSEAARSAKLISGHPIRPIRPIRPIPHTTHQTLLPLKQPFFKVENDLSLAFHKPKIRPENKGIKPKSNRHKPNFFTTRFGGWLARKGGHVVVRPPWYLVHNLCPSVPLALFPVLRYSRRRRFSKFYE